jgi:regulator of cell morphogenesis and NO signaling
MNKVQISDGTGISPVKGVHNIEVLKNMDVDLWYDRDNAGKEVTQGTSIVTQGTNAIPERIFMREKTDMQEVLSWDLSTVLDYISENHHQFARKKAVAIYDLAQKVAYGHSGSHPELNKLVTIMFLFLHDLFNHIAREEQILFPNIKQLLKRNHQSEKGTYTTFGLIKEWVVVMQREHLTSCKNLEVLNVLTNNYSTPSDACSSYKLLFSLMKEFETDFLRLVQFENNIVFPKALLEDGESPEISF